ncbi:DUF5615 family PIN-like protein [Spirulina sp. 06S082]|uniref:DUF5615 family PIN-like protein n=1 Tax=Spirulina sp. 06S082 TaxID=3110248 RepID=UPI002B1F98ED|nr:DUF5615 family PIN-like protein [Spirulina sp. 06S082]MEA5468171.1 DUF5615 family PIN-like protein [Spirulina sp. 06S082]
MTLQYLLDENVDPLYKTQLLRQAPTLTVLLVGDRNTPEKGTLDPEILCWCEENSFILVTNNRTSMPIHLTEHIANDRHIPGIFILNPNLSIGQIIDELIAIAEASFEDEYRDQIRYLPLLE